MDTNTATDGTSEQRSRDMEIANNILSHLPRLWAAMISGKAMATSMGVRIQFKGCRKANLWIVQLDADDTYTVRLVKKSGGRWNSRKGEFSPVREQTVLHLEGVYNNQLREIFERETGLRLGLR